MWIADKWKDFKVIDASCGEKLESWSGYKLIRPDPQVIWKTEKGSDWKKNIAAHYHRSEAGGGKWEIFNLPEVFSVSYRDLKFNLKPMGFKHTGLFPEQAVNWDYMTDVIKNAGREVKALNLFAYTGGATVAALKAGAHVVHVDASKGMVAWAKENAAASGAADLPVRWIVDDCIKFVRREIRRGNKYDILIMDPPSYGRGPGGEVWKLENEIYSFVELCSQVLSDDPLMVLINSYTTGLSPSVMEYMLGSLIKPKYGGRLACDEIGLKVSESGMVLPCGASAMWLGK